MKMDAKDKSILNSRSLISFWVFDISFSAATVRFLDPVKSFKRPAPFPFPDEVLSVKCVL